MRWSSIDALWQRRGMTHWQGRSRDSSDVYKGPTQQSASCGPIKAARKRASRSPAKRGVFEEVSGRAPSCPLNRDVLAGNAPEFIPHFH